MPYQDAPALQPSIVREEPFTGLHAEHEMLKGAYAELETDLRNAREVLTEYDKKYDSLQAAHDRLKAEHAEAIKQKPVAPPPEMKTVQEDAETDAE